MNGDAFVSVPFARFPITRRLQQLAQTDSAAVNNEVAAFVHTLNTDHLSLAQIEGISDPALDLKLRRKTAPIFFQNVNWTPNID